MAPSASLQSRINAFENLQSIHQSNNGEHPKPNSHSAVRGGLPRLSFPPSSADRHILDSDPTSPTADSLTCIPPIQPISSSRPSSPPALGRKSSLIHFSELSSPQLKPTSPITSNATGSTSSSSSISDTARKPQLPPRSAFQSPPLPPRKPSLASLKAASISAPPPLPKRHVSSPVSRSPNQPPSSGALLDLPESHTYPPASPLRGGLSRHIPTSSTSSFHSVSLSSDGGETREDSLDGSYEAVSSTVATSPVSSQHSWENDLHSTLKPNQSWQKHDESSPTTPVSRDVSQVAARRPAPPPPRRRTTKPEVPPDGKLKSAYQRPVPIPANVKQRYDALFDRNFVQHSQKGGRSSGWRGVSVDLITSGSETPRPNFGESTAGEERLPGSVVKLIWSCSKLPKARLREIWNECDQDKVGSLTREEFAQGTWRIDEALRIAQQTRIKKKPPSPSRLPAVQLPPPSYNTSYNTRPPLPLRKPSFLFS